MNKKSQVVIIAVILILAVVAFFFLRITKPSEDADRADINPIGSIGDKVGFQGVRDPIDTSKGHMSFEGFGPGKSHLGKFNDWSGDLYIEKGEIVGFEGTINTDSAKTDSSGVDKHLKTEDFFNVEKYPAIKFKSKNLESNKIAGDLTFLGTTKEISFPVIITDNSISADFVLDTAQFRDKSKETSDSSWLFKANDEVRIFFELVK